MVEMHPVYSWDSVQSAIFRGDGMVFDPWAWSWSRVEDARVGDTPSIDASTALLLQARARECRRLPIGVIGPREATSGQRDVAEAVGRGLAELGMTVVCGGKSGVMEAVAKGARALGGMSVGLLPDHDWREANIHIDMPIATGLSEGRNMVIAKSALVLLAIGGSYGTLSEVAYGLHFGKLVIGLEGAPDIEGVQHAKDPSAAIGLMAENLLERAPVSEI